FAGEDRDYVEQVAASLQSLGVVVFYDRYEEVDLWGKDLYVHLDEVYRTKARYCVVFISEHYGRKLWTSHERRSAQARAFSESREYILPARFDDTEISGILPTVGFVSLKGLTAEAFSHVIKSKLELTTTGQDRQAPPPFRRIYYEGFDCGALSQKEIKSRFGGLWLIGKKGHWQGRIANGVYQVSNLSAPDASLTNQIRYYEPDDQAIDLADCRVSVRVRIAAPNDGHSGAGLIVRAEDRGSNYYAFLLHPGNSVSLAEMQLRRLQFLWSQETPEFDPRVFVTLKAVGRGSSVAFYVNESLLHTVKNAELLSGNTGTIALSTGRFEFDDFSIYLPQMPEAKPA
ncbi:MAG TPA: TIR domain-containing protein, partial [Planctomycetaceae bacterium]|nr:TIR domain-containing protein [Planctomycetaceae bacterium]